MKRYRWNELDDAGRARALARPTLSRDEALRTGVTAIKRPRVSTCSTAPARRSR